MRKLVIGIVGVMVLAFAGQSQAVGTGTLDKVSGWFPAGTNLTVTATPAADSNFKDWTGSATGIDPQISFTVDGAKALTATFSLKTYQVVFNEGLYGTLSGSATQTVSHGSSAAEPTIMADPGYTFTGWDTLAFTNVTSALAVTALYTTNNYTLTFDSAGGSTVDPITQAYGTIISAPSDPTLEGYTFMAWSPAIPGTMPAADQTHTAQWQIKTYTLTYLAGADGSISGSTNQTVNHGSSGTEVTAVPGDGYSFISWNDGVLTASRTDLNVTDNITATASFGINQYAFTVNSDHGAPTPSGTTNYTHGTLVNFEMPVSTIVEGVTTQYVANGWVSTGSLEGSATGTSGSFTITNNTAMTWQWSTNYWVELDVVGE